MTNNDKCYRGSFQRVKKKEEKWFINFIIHLFLIVIFYWITVDLKCFKCTEKWFNYTHIYIFHIILHYRLLQDIEYSSLGYTLGFCCLFTLYIVVYLVITNLPLPSIF